MGRKVRVFLEDTPQHIYIESLSDVEIFRDNSDCELFYENMLTLSKKNSLNIHSYTFMKNFIEFVATPETVESLPKFMQSLGKTYVTYYNKKYNRTGTIWSGRYKSSIVEPKIYLLPVMRYIESFSSQYSSHPRNALAQKDPLIVFHEQYKTLGFTDEVRIKEYNSIELSLEKAEFISQSVAKQTVTGSDYYIKELEKKIGEKLTPRKRGRPKTEKEKAKKMYKNLVVLDKAKHQDLKIKPLADLNFAKGMKFIPTLIKETGNIGATFPVVFTSDEKPGLVSIVSLGGDNLAINAEGKWITSYVPSLLRKYPFNLASTKEDANNKVILIDEESELFSTSEGAALFNEDGTASEALENAKNFLIGFEQEANLTSNVLGVIAESGILEEREISVGEGDEKKVLVNGFKVVSEEALYKLSDDVLADWARKGILRFIDEHIKSLNHINTLFKLVSNNQ